MLPSVVASNMLKWAVGTHVWLVDADLWFFSTPDPVLGEIAAARASVAATPHRFPARYASYADRGRFCQCASYFANDETGRCVADRWAAACLDKCDESTVGDQLALNEFPALAGDRFREIEHIGWAAGPWNALDTYSIPCNGMVRLRLHEPDHPLICYHFHELRESSPADQRNLFDVTPDGWYWEWQRGGTPLARDGMKVANCPPGGAGRWRLTDYPLGLNFVDQVYAPYVRELESCIGGTASS
jgi:hypothetical protein